jgi:hypothetical protein
MFSLQIIVYTKALSPSLQDKYGAKIHAQHVGGRIGSG